MIIVNGMDLDQWEDNGKLIDDDTGTREKVIVTWFKSPKNYKRCTKYIQYRLKNTEYESVDGDILNSFYEFLLSKAPDYDLTKAIDNRGKVVPMDAYVVYGLLKQYVNFKLSNLQKNKDISLDKSYGDTDSEDKENDLIDTLFNDNNERKIDTALENCITEEELMYELSEVSNILGIRVDKLTDILREIANNSKIKLSNLFEEEYIELLKCSEYMIIWLKRLEAEKRRH